MKLRGKKVKDKILENIKEIRINKISFRDFVNYEMGK